MNACLIKETREKIEHRQGVMACRNGSKIAKDIRNE